MALPTPELDAERVKRLDAFLTEYGVTLRTDKLCMRRLFGKRCRVGWRDHNYGQETPDKDGFPCHPPGCDHPQMAYKNGKPWAFIFQPYYLSAEQILQLDEMSKRLGLMIEISQSKSWHYPDWTILVIVRRLEVNP